MFYNLFVLYTAKRTDIIGMAVEAAKSDVSPAQRQVKVSTTMMHRYFIQLASNLILDRNYFVFNRCDSSEHLHQQGCSVCGCWIIRRNCLFAPCGTATP
jgi:hypothetical protein